MFRGVSWLFKLRTRGRNSKRKTLRSDCTPVAVWRLSLAVTSSLEITTSSGKDRQIISFLPGCELHALLFDWSRPFSRTGRRKSIEITFLMRKKSDCQSNLSLLKTCWALAFDPQTESLSQERQHILSKRACRRLPLGNGNAQCVTQKRPVCVLSIYAPTHPTNPLELGH